MLNMKLTILVIMLLASATSTAEVFKRVGPDGRIYFSDQPGPDATRVDLAPVQTFTPPSLPQRTGNAPETEDQYAGGRESSITYHQFSITSPTNDESVRANDGNVTIHFLLEPDLAPGHSITLNMAGEDGESKKTVNRLSVELSNLSRGHHAVIATVADEDGSILIQSDPVAFNVLRAALGRP